MVITKQQARVIADLAERSADGSIAIKMEVSEDGTIDVAYHSVNEPKKWTRTRVAKGGACRRIRH